MAADGITVAESGRNPVSKQHITITIFDSSVENERADAGPVSRPIFQARTGTRARLAAICPVDPCSAESADHTYIHTW